MVGQCGIEFAHVTGVVLAVVDAHGLLVYGRFEGIKGKTELGQGESRCAVIGRRLSGTGSPSATEERGNERGGDHTDSGDASNLEKGAFVHGVGFEGTNWVTRVIMKPLLFTLVQRWPVDRESGT